MFSPFKFILSIILLINVSSFFFLLFFDYLAQCIERYKNFKISKPASSSAEQRDELERLQRAFNSLKTKDISIVKVGVDFTDALLPLAVEQCSVVNDPTHTSAGKALAAIGVLAWFCTKIRPSVSNKFPLYLKALYESDNEVVDEVAIKAWHAATKGNLFP